jgi:mannose-6-phosphate isomerase-like protein (cupin superfamily)
VAFLVGAGLAAAVGHLNAQQAAPHPRGQAGIILSADQGQVLIRGDDGGAMLLKIGPVTSGSKHLVLGSLTIPPGTGVDVHRRPRHEEVLFLHRGQVTLTLGSRHVPVLAGTTVYVPPGTWWGIQNTGREVATALFIFGQAEVEQCFRKVILHLSPADSARVERACPFAFQESEQ